MPLIAPFQDTLHSLIAANLTAGANPLVPSGFKPTVDLILSYGGSQVTMGNLFPTTVCTNPPNITFFSEDPAKSSLSYTVMLIDPDAPTPQSPIYADWCHWILPGLRPTSYNEIIKTLSNSSDSASDNETASDAEKVIQTRMPIVPYYPPSPNPRSDPHRYIFLLYREPSPRLDSYVALKSEDIGISNTSAMTRKSFNTSLFVETYQLTLVGANWFRGVDIQRINEFKWKRTVYTTTFLLVGNVSSTDENLIKFNTYLILIWTYVDVCSNLFYVFMCNIRSFLSTSFSSLKLTPIWHYQSHCVFPTFLTPFRSFHGYKTISLFLFLYLFTFFCLLSSFWFWFLVLCSCFHRKYLSVLPNWWFLFVVATECGCQPACPWRLLSSGL